MPLIRLDCLEVGDYVLATKYAGGSPRDEWGLGFYNGIKEEYCPDEKRFDVVDLNGNSLRKNGFQRAQKISHQQGEWLWQHQESLVDYRYSLYSLVSKL